MLFVSPCGRPSWLRRWLVLLGFALASGSLTGCASAPLVSTDVPTNAALTPQAERAAAALRLLGDEWQGVPYRWGGTDRSGIDCSAFVQMAVARVFGQSVPRTTEAQARIGRRVDPSSLQPGDLLVFRPERGRRHTGVYLSHGEFLHASTSSGVRISDLRDAYWQRRWSQARRVPTEATPPAKPGASPRPGW